MSSRRPPGVVRVPPGQSLWLDRDRRHFYVLPVEALLPAGEYRLRSLEGAQVSVTREGVAPHELPEDAARARVIAHLDAAWKTVRSRFGALVDAGRRAAAEAGGAPGEAADPEMLPPAWARWVRAAAHRLEREPDAAPELARAWLDHVGKAARKAADEAGPAVAEAFERTRERLAAGRSAAGPLDAAQREHVARVVERLGAGLKEAAERIRQPAAGGAHPGAGRQPD